MKVKFEHIQKALQKDFDNKMKQLRFNSMLALNDLAKEIKYKTIPEEFKKQFTVRNKQFTERTEYDRATKSRLYVSLKFPHDQMEIHTNGGTKTPKKKKNLSIPMPDLKEKSFRAKGGAVKNSYKPSNVKKSFLLQSGSGRKYIVRRTKNDVEFLYRLTPEARIKKDFDFQKVCIKTRDKLIGDFLEKRLKEAKAKNRL